MQYKHISTAIKTAEDYIKGRKEGTIKSVSLPHTKLNKKLMGGLEWNKIVSLVGSSGSGKSAILEQWKHGILKDNEEKIKILSFEFEMLAMDQVTRTVSSKLDKTVSYLYSAEDNKLTDNEYEQVQHQLEKIKDANIYYVDDFCTVEQVEESVMNFAKEELESDEHLLVTIDHILLTRGKQGQEELHIVRDLYNKCIELKKRFESNGRKIMIILIGQLNRKIKNTERIVNNKLHYPTDSDIFGSSYAYYSSDYVLITHKPALIPGIEMYGPPVQTETEVFPRGLPVWDDDRECYIYWHLIKNRSGDTAILQMKDKLKYSKVVDC
jgi:replicative DNA helicase